MFLVLLPLVVVVVVLVVVVIFARCTPSLMMQYAEARGLSIQPYSLALSLCVMGYQVVSVRAVSFDPVVVP